MHPDPYYRNHASQSSACHRKKPKKEPERASKYGTPYSECDSPLVLTNFTLDYLDKHWADEVDFVVWTGDNARHDNDRKLPRTLPEIYSLNRAVAAKMKSVFSSRGIPVIPSLGNNDVWPHNIMTPGPNGITNEFSSIWRTFIPFPSYQVFQRGAYYSTEVIPNELAVIAMNTMYFYEKNKAVGGCQYREQDDPGNLQLDWLDVQLDIFRRRGIQVYITGHVPPSHNSYHPECYVRYAELALRYQSTILGHLYGHMNSDHFSFLEADDLEFISESDEKMAGSVIAQEEKKPMDLYHMLLKEYEALPSTFKKTNEDDFAVVNISPPVVPNPYLPTFRVFSYNISDAATDKYRTSKKKKHGRKRGHRENKKKICKERPFHDMWKCRLKQAWYSDEDSPSRTNRRLTPLGYAQYHIPHLEKAGKKHSPEVKLSYVTYSRSMLRPEEGFEKDWHYPVPMKQLPRALREGNWTGHEGQKFLPYELEDLTVGSWLSLGRRLADRTEKKLRKQYRKFMYHGLGHEG